MEYCIREAKSGGRSGVCMLGAKKQKNWLSDQAFAKRYGFQTVDETEDGYELLALSFDGSVPRFTDGARRSELDAQELTIFYDRQCPFISQTIDRARQLCDAEGIPARFIEVCSLEQAKELPCVFNNFAVFNRGRFVTVNLLDPTQLRKLAAK